MQPRRRRRPPPPWERRQREARHPVGRTRRRWPRAYDGGVPDRNRLNRRYRRAFDGAANAERRRRVASGFQQIRRSPARSGLIGLVVAGAAVPVATQRFQADRTDPGHEQTVQLPPHERINDAQITEAWEAMEAERLAGESEERIREETIRENMARYSEYNVSRQMAEQIYDAAVENEIDPDIAFGLVRAESSFRNTATSVVGATGLTQLMPRTAAWMEPGVTPNQLRDQRTNLRIGFKYLNYLMDKYDGNADLALLAYNRGPGTVDRALRQGANPDNGYADFVKGVEGHGHTLFTR